MRLVCSSILLVLLVLFSWISPSSAAEWQVSFYSELTFFTTSAYLFVFPFSSLFFSFFVE